MDIENDWEQFNVYVKKLVDMIMKIHRKEEFNHQQHFSKEEYNQCNMLVFSMVKDTLDDSVITRNLQEEFACFINSNVIYRSNFRFKRLLRM